MRKTIDLNKEEIEIVEKYKDENKLKSFSDAVRNIIRKDIEEDVSDSNFALIADALISIDEKVSLLTVHLAPKGAGEVK